VSDVAWIALALMFNVGVWTGWLTGYWIWWR
jgi:hypothetical protein